MNAAPPAILLDLDGTLVDSAPGIISSCRAALRTLGHTLKPSTDLSGLIGPPIEEIMRTLLAPFGDDRVADAVAAYRADYGERGLFGSEPYRGIPEALAELRAEGARLFVATSKRRRFARRILEHLELADGFEGIHGSEDGGALDHKPELIAYVVARHALAPSRSVMVGDRRYDIAGARANGLRSLGVLWGYGSRDELIAAGADGVVTAPENLPSAALAAVQGDVESVTDGQQ